MPHKAMDEADAAGMLDADDLLAPLWGGDEPEDTAGLPALQPERALDLPLRLVVQPRPYQRDAVRRWLEAEGRGVVVLPTGAGKTIVAMMAMEAVGARTLVVVPTIELLRQWRTGLTEKLGVPAESVGVIGGGEYDPRRMHPLERLLNLVILLLETPRFLTFEQIRERLPAYDEAVGAHRPVSSPVSAMCSRSAFSAQPTAGRGRPKRPSRSS